MPPRSSASGQLFPQHAPSSPQHYLVAYTDGGARGNPGPAGYGVVIQNEVGQEIATLSEYLGHQTNNFAEYQALIAALEYAVQQAPKALKVISDSELLVRQINGIYKVKNPTLRRFKSTRSNPKSSTIRAASAMTWGSLPNNCAEIGCSSS